MREVWLICFSCIWLWCWSVKPVHKTWVRIKIENTRYRRWCNAPACLKRFTRPNFVVAKIWNLLSERSKEMIQRRLRISSLRQLSIHHEWRRRRGRSFVSLDWTICTCTCLLLVSSHCYGRTVRKNSIRHHPILLLAFQIGHNSTLCSILWVQACPCSECDCRLLQNSRWCCR